MSTEIQKHPSSIREVVPLRELPDPSEPPAAPTVLTKLRILQRCHAVAARARLWRRLQFAPLLVACLALAGGLGAAAGLGTFWVIYTNPERYTHYYYQPFGGRTFYVHGQQVSQQEYDYFISSNSNFPHALPAGLGAGFAAGFLVLGLTVAGAWWVTGRALRPRLEPLEAQIAGILRDHAETVQGWGGPSVLRQPELVAEILRIEEARPR